MLVVLDESLAEAPGVISSSVGPRPSYSPSFLQHFRRGVLRNSGTLRLPQEAGWIVSVSLVCHNLAILDVEHVDGLNLYPLAGRSDALKLSLVGAAHGHSSRHPIPFGHHVLDANS